MLHFFVKLRWKVEGGRGSERRVREESALDPVLRELLAITMTELAHKKELANFRRRPVQIA